MIEGKPASKIDMMQEREENIYLFFGWLQEDVALRKEHTEIEDFIEI